MEAYEGYWVKANQSNIYLMFDTDAQTTATNQDVPPASVRAVARAQDAPPRPLYGFDGDNVQQSERNGCFIETVATGSAYRSALAIGVLLILVLTLIRWIHPDFKSNKR